MFGKRYRNFVKIIMSLYSLFNIECLYAQSPIQIDCNDLDKGFIKIVKKYIASKKNINTFLIVSDTNFTYDTPWSLHHIYLFAIGPFYDDLIKKQNTSKINFDDVISYDYYNGNSSIVERPETFTIINNKKVYIQSSLDKLLMANDTITKEGKKNITKYIDEAQIILLTTKFGIPKFELLQCDKYWFKHFRIKEDPFNLNK